MDHSERWWVLSSLAIKGNTIAIFGQIRDQFRLVEAMDLELLSQKKMIIVII